MVDEVVAATLPDEQSNAPSRALIDGYVASMPSLQNAIDAVPGWNHAFPPSTGLRAGEAHLYADDRIAWCIARYGSLAGRSILELGPLEGMHSYMLAQTGAKQVVAVEANVLAYMRCLVSKEVFSLNNVSFLLGDFMAWLADDSKHYDLIVASGVLYHSQDPIHLLDLIARRSDSFFIWTHYYADSLATDPRGGAFSGTVTEYQFKDRSFRLHERGYHQAWLDNKFCGGLRDRHFWMRRDDILEIIALLGFTSEVAQEMPDHPNGPCFCIFARRM